MVFTIAVNMKAHRDMDDKTKIICFYITIESKPTGGIVSNLCIVNKPNSFDLSGDNALPPICTLNCFLAT